MSLPLTEFFKMSGAGNDFIAFDNRSQSLGEAELRPLVTGLCRRAISVGADGVFVLEHSSEADVRVRFFNPDGRPTFCGNAARCAARLAFLKGIAPARMRIETKLGLHRAEVSGSDVSFEMRPASQFEEGVEVASLGRLYRGSLLDTGVPHYVIIEAGPQTESIEEIGRALRRHPRFAPEGANINFVHPLPEGGFAIRTYERGVEGETLACGTGCVAASLALATEQQVPSPIRLRTRSGSILQVRFEGEPRRAGGIRLEGEARLVFVGHLTDEAIGAFPSEA